MLINLSDEYFLMIEPDKEGPPLTTPIEDELSNKVDYIFSKCKPLDYSFRGFHQTKCFKVSDNKNWFLPNGMITNSLYTYYIRYYRNYVPQSEIDKINKIYNELTK
ncbi:MAG: hypothetical protein A4E53_02467 [Pelotomaculum sp. PtaB.Bin104]|nr:MAG: hypothetical protein A4E53_02467 [Pelotomaculum sp. PtaB.Bin104]